jgi:hypothetical protein
MTTSERDATGGVLLLPSLVPARLGREGSGAPLGADEAVCLAQGWRRTLEVCEWLKRLDGGRPLLELVGDL